MGIFIDAALYVTIGLKHKKAKEWNEKAGLIKPNDLNYLYNKKYFKRIFNMN